jgi:hypothetical protein
MTVVFNTDDKSILNMFKAFAEDANIKYNVLDNPFTTNCVSLPGNPISNKELELHIENSLTSGKVTLEDFKKKR